VARRSGVSKPTIYRYFPDKQALYAAFVRERCEQFSQSIFRLDLKEEDIRGALMRIARSYVELTLSPKPRAVFRTVLAEAQRCPELGRAFYEAGPARSCRRLSQVLAAAVARGQLDIEDVDSAAWQFLELCRGDVFYKLQFQVVTEVGEEEKARLAEEAVNTFLRAFAPREAPAENAAR
jgi:AcrR family transcriptional regulator